MSQRFRSLDIFRGATVALMILVNNPGSWSHLYPPLAHAGWHGCTPTDLVFPFFLFAVGNALAFVMPGLKALAPAAFWARVLKRTAIIFAIGLFLNASPFVRWDAEGALALKSFESLRFMGVLQRIALCFGAAAATLYFSTRFFSTTQAALWAAAALLVGYWLACRQWGHVPDAADPTGPYELLGWFGTSIDRALLGASHLYKGEGLPFDPEGLVSTLPAIAQVLLGWWVGDQVVRGTATTAATATTSPPDATSLTALVVRLFMGATLLLIVAYGWQLEMPFNKKIWTSSYVLHTTGLAMMALAALIYIIEIRAKASEQTVWANFFEVFGKNPLFVFVLSGFVPRVLALVRWADGVKPDGSLLWSSPLPWIYQTFFANVSSDPRLGSFAFALANLTCYWLLARWLDRRRIYIKV
jgi:predicted acyltransferase